MYVLPDARPSAPSACRVKRKALAATVVTPWDRATLLQLAPGVDIAPRALVDAEITLGLQYRHLHVASCIGLVLRRCERSDGGCQWSGRGTPTGITFRCLPAASIAKKAKALELGWKRCSLGLD